MTSQATQRQVINRPQTQGIYDKYHVSQAVRVGDIVWTTAQPGLDATLTPAEGVEAQTRLAFENLRAVLEAAGATLADVVDLTWYYTRDLDHEAFLRVKDEFIPPPYPACAAFGVELSAGLLVELRAVAVIGSAASRDGG